MKIDLNEAMVEPTQEEIDRAIRGFMRFNIQRDRIIRTVVPALQENPNAYVAIRVTEKLTKGTGPLFMQGKFLGLPMTMDIHNDDYSVTLVSKDDIDNQVDQAMKDSKDLRESTGEA